EARTLFGELGDQAAQADALRWRARLRLSAGDAPGALSLAEQALDLDEDGDCLSRLAMTLRLKTRVLREQGELQKAQQLTRRSIRAAEDALDLSQVARGLVARADLLSVAGDVRAGRAQLEAALAVWERVGNEAGVAETRVRLGRAYLTTGELRAAEEQLAQAGQGFKPMADRSRTADVNASLAWTWLLRGDLSQARDHVDRALEDAQSAGTPGPRLEAQRVQAELYLAQGDLAGALELARRTADEATRAALGRVEGLARIVIGTVLLAQGNSVEAERELREAFDLAEECGEGSLAARARLGIARVHLLRGEPAGTLGEVEKARDVAQSHQDAALEVQSLLALSRMHLFLGQAKRAGTLAEMARDRSAELELHLFSPEANLLRGAAILQRVEAGDDQALLQTAEALLEEAERESSARRGLQADIDVVRARLELARNAVGAARERAESALEASRITDDRSTGIRAELALARVRRTQGRLEEAKTAADHALTEAEAARDSEARAWALVERGATYLALKAPALAGHDLREAASEVRGVWASLPEDLREDYQSRPLVRQISQTAAELAELLERTMPAESPAPSPAEEALSAPMAEVAAPADGSGVQGQGGVQLESLRDPLTNLFNHTFFTAQLETEIKRALRHSRPLALLKVNVDRFKLVRELYGAKTGKRVIREVAQLLLRHVRDVDIVARYFGDEFEVLLPDTDQRGALLTAERIREAAESFRFEHDQERVELTLSMGVAVFPHDAKDRDAIICRADEALYHARSRGSNSVFSFGASEEVLGEGNAELRELDQLMLTREGRTILSMVQRLVNQELDIDHVIELVTGMVVEATRGERGFIMLKGGQDGQFRFRHGRNIDDKVINSPELKISNGIAREVAETGRAIHVSEALEDGRFKDFKSVMDLNLRSILCAPIKHGDDVLGVIYVDHNQVARNFSQEDLNFLEAIADRVAIPLHNSKKLRETEDRLAMAEARLRSQSAQLQTKYAYDTIVGRSEEMQRVFKLLDRIVETTHSVVIHGESGTGKELIARAIHYNGPRKNKPFVAENCAALSETLLEAELFGHVKGAFTGADRDSKGLFELANGGTLFLDEIGDMSERMQKKLLRVLQEGEVRPVGGKRVFHVDVRIISASNKDLKKLVQERKFREDLYYRLNVITVNLPPLRERSEDVVLLVEHFLAQHEEAGSPRRLDRETMQHMLSYDWPGNVRELENEVNRLVAMSDDLATPDLLSPKIREGSKTVAKESDGLNRYLGRALKDAEHEFMRELITHTLDQTNWHRTKAAKMLKVPTSTLFNKMKKYGIG
ncbi:MAG: sigma 54-interacting transcriptional regulator, partial [Planctomycetes bacterium]|nr:sigma 54-interacting transcriptional regulator [Planctomycetota bacterium]